VGLVGALAVGTRPCWTNTEPPTHVNVLQAAFIATNGVFYFNSPRRGRARIIFWPCDGGGNLIGGARMSLDFYVRPAHRYFNGVAPPVFSFDWQASQNYDDPMGVGYAAGTCYSVGAFDNNSQMCSLDIDVGPGFHQVQMERLRQLNQTVGASNLYALVTWQGDVGNEPPTETIYDVTSLANTALDTGIMNFDDFDTIHVGITGSAALGAAPVLSFIAVSDADGVPLSIVGQCTTTAALSQAAQSFGPGASLGYGMAATSQGFGSALPKRGKLTLQGAGGAVTCRMVVYGRRKVRR
jgi:hypothetical protein